jgi:hypothetical protein
MEVKYMECLIEKLGGKYHISTYGGSIGNPYNFQKHWGIQMELTMKIFNNFEVVKIDGLYCLEDKEKAEAALTILTLLRR